MHSTLRAQVYSSYKKIFCSYSSLYVIEEPQSKLLYISAIGLCDASLLPELAHGRKVAVKNFRGSVYKYVCDGDYKRVGQGQVHCAGGVWDLLHPPVCTSKPAM
jgi:hypothetical protein